ncbi:MAG TPA: hypothetical protein ENK48_01530 [Gammaproteobacteria bacterium]|nr:hypothetical protein [Gammaproteobacteria bacterium]
MRPARAGWFRRRPRVSRGGGRVGAARAILACVLAGLLAGACGVGPGRTPFPEPSFRPGGGATTGPLRVERIEVAFADGRPDATVPRGAPLSAQAEIRFSGNGVFRARWLLDGGVIAQETLQVTYGPILTLPLRAPLATFEPGRHRLVLEIIEPSTPLSPVEVFYFVTASDPAPAAERGSER